MVSPLGSRSDCTISSTNDSHVELLRLWVRNERRDTYKLPIPVLNKHTKSVVMVISSKAEVPAVPSCFGWPHRPLPRLPDPPPSVFSWARRLTSDPGRGKCRKEWMDEGGETNWRAISTSHTLRPLKAVIISLFNKTWYTRCILYRNEEL